MNPQKRLLTMLVAAAGLMILPFILQGFGNAWVRIADMALLYVLLAIGLNIVVGYAGLLDLGYVAFFAIGAYMYGLMSSPHLIETFPAIAAMFPDGMHTPLWLVIPLGAALAGVLGVLLGAPTLRLRGDYLAIVTLGFGEIIRVFMNNLDHPVNITNGPKGINQIDPLHFFGLNLDPMYDQAVEVVLKNRKASISLVQRHLKIGYNRAARLVEDMEKAGLVSAMSGSGQREILVPSRNE